MQSNISILLPYGAVTSVDEVRELENQTVYIVLGLGERTGVYPITIGPVNTVTYKNEGTAFYVTYEDEDNHKSILFVDDVNVGDYLYGMNYMFKNIEDAEDYADWAEHNTVLIKRHKKFLDI